VPLRIEWKRRIRDAMALKRAKFHALCVNFTHQEAVGDLGRHVFFTNHADRYAAPDEGSKLIGSASRFGESSPRSEGREKDPVLSRTTVAQSLGEQSEVPVPIDLLV